MVYLVDTEQLIFFHYWFNTISRFKEKDPTESLLAHAWIFCELKYDCGAKPFHYMANDETMMQLYQNIDSLAITLDIKISREICKSGWYGI